MTGEEFRRLITEIGTSPTDFAHSIGVAIRVAQRWARGTADVPPAVAALLRISHAVALKEPYPAIARQMRAEADRLEQPGAAPD